MKKITFNDGRTMFVQSAEAAGGVLHIRLILTSSDLLKAHFGDTFAASKMTLTENGVEKNIFGGYEKLSYLKEEAGGIWEVEMIQEKADPVKRIEVLEEANQKLTNALQEAIVELTIAMAEGAGV